MSTLFGFISPIHDPVTEPDQVMTEAGVKRRFVAGLDTSGRVVVYAKLLRCFLNLTLVDDYNSDWAPHARGLGSVCCGQSLFGKSPDDGSWQLHRAIDGHETTEIRAFAQKLNGPPDHLSGSDAVSKQALTIYERLTNIIRLDLE